ncbi:hypothetical protein EV385_2588 [Krasilnikovia cinnamomea]|uniref:Uncharacterized protein n=1 Tax=Krasilnikovia cinnamomea TaxID=349313 RepID=A0A4Q7ZJW2_9ACTN|nr:hypothetical protein [Krasilnikovia cinnamomea]RZU50804.1 hypothetical protein EV385_2588 [Krasilnikovia cinnamomea]
MSFDLDQRLTETLNSHTGAEIDPTPLVAYARDRGGRLRRRRRGLMALGASACVALVAAVAVTPFGGRFGHLTRPASELVLPASPSQPGAAEQPNLVGTDPGTLHFSADDLLAGAANATWSAGRGTEIVEYTGPAGQARVVLARSAASLDGIRQTLASSGRPQPPTDVRVAGRPGIAWIDPGPSGGTNLWFVRWRPVDGLWAQMESYADSREGAIGAAGKVRFDSAHRCAVPFRLESLPTGARLLECSVNLGYDGRSIFAEGSLVVGDQGGRWLTVRVQRTENVGAQGGELSAGPYRVHRQGSDVLKMSATPGSVEVFLDGWGNGYAESDGLAVLGGYRPVGDVNDPETW